jgi:hypothetical protein
LSREKNFLLGHGERLTANVEVPSGGGAKKPPYTLAQAKDRIKQKLLSASKELNAIPQNACPKNEVVALVTMHPRYNSKSDFPEELFRSVGLRSVGSRSTKVKPEEWGVKKHPEGQVVTEQIFVAGTKNAFNQIPEKINSWKETEKPAVQISRIEDFLPFAAQDKIKLIPSDCDELLLEVVLHNDGSKAIIDAFEAYVYQLDSKPIMDRLMDVRGLTFIPVRAPTSKTFDLAQFSFLRVIRKMPGLRPIVFNDLRSVTMTDVILPEEKSLNSNVRAVIFDGGVPNSVNLSKWVTSIDPVNIGPPSLEWTKHGVAVTSALLFGSISQPKLPIPFCNIDHVRVMDKRGSSTNDQEILDVLNRILEHLDKNANKYHFVNISFGPDLVVADDEVTAWTAALDEKLSKIDMLTAVAVGNDGELDAIDGLNRIKPPSDGVNVLAVGSCDQNGKRASYSCIGPGRRPGFVKPDGLAFGGTDETPFMVLSASSKPMAWGTFGTSFASPNALRTAIGVKSYIGDDIFQRTIRALMIHRADSLGHSMIEVGWGYFESDVSRLITCEDDEVLVLYQGELPVGKHLRAPIPMPKSQIEGMITITATLVIASETDPEHPGAYTRSGLEVVFRPHMDKFNKSKEGQHSKHPKTKSFFSAKNMYGETEYELREDGHKWEPCLKNAQSFKSSSLKDPCLDIYYHHREGVAITKDRKPIPYSLVISVKAPEAPDFYNQIVRAYTNILIPLRPQVQILVHSQ